MDESSELPVIHFLARVMMQSAALLTAEQVDNMILEILVVNNRMYRC